MNWKDTVLAENQIKGGKLTLAPDGKYEIRLGLLNLLEGQAKQSFGRGVIEALAFVGAKQERGEIISLESLHTFLRQCGLQSIVSELQKLTEKGSGTLDVTK